MTSILNPQVIKKYSNRKITKSFLEKHHFYRKRWGCPRDRELDASIFYEATYADGLGIVKNGVAVYSIQASIMYFPDDFNGYTSIGKKPGYGNVAGKLVITYENGPGFEYAEEIGYTTTKIFDCKTHADFYDAIDYFNIDLIAKKYTSITF